MKSSSHFTVFEYGHLVSEEGDARINNAVVLPADLFKWLELRCLKDDAAPAQTTVYAGGVKSADGCE